jgi:branched-chain amino acid transport system substrate-binding protein
MSEKEEVGIDKNSVSRRDFLKIAGVAGAAVGMGAGLGGILAACGGDEETTTTAAGETTTTAAGETTTTAAGAEMGREVKIGFVTPLTGALASFGIPDQYCVERATEAIGDGVVCGDGMKHPVTIITMDSQSDSNRAAQVTGDLINNDNVDLVTAASTPDTVAPVADQCEANSTPCITNDCPWQSYIATRSGGDITATYTWTYHTFWGLEDVQACFLDMWSQVPNNKVVGCMFPNDADGNAWLPGWDPVWPETGYTAIIPSQFQNFTEDFTAQITQFKNEGCEVGMGVFLPPDFTNFWKQRAQQGWNPKLGTYAKALLFPQSIEALGDIGIGLTTEVWWTPAHPFTSPLVNQTCKEFADEFTARTELQWTQPLLHFIVFEMAVDALQRATSVDDKQAILDAIKTTKMDTIGGPIDFTAPVVGATPPFQVGPCHIVENVYKTPLVGGQWRAGMEWPYDLTICSNAAGSMIEVQGTVEPLPTS